jgi:hypothetical protein
MTIEAPTEDPSRYAPREVRLAELVALGLLAVEGLVILGSVAAAIANQVQFGGQNFSAVGAHAWGYTLSLASAWSAPWAVAVFLLGPLALVAWMGQREGDEISEDRTRVVLRLELLLAVLTVIGGTVSIVGRVMQVSPPQQWSAFFENLGSSLGSVVLGILGIVVVKWLADDLQIELLSPRGVGDPVEGDEPG